MDFGSLQSELGKLVRLVHKRARYCTPVATNPGVATSESHAQDAQRKHRIAELSARYGTSL